MNELPSSHFSGHAYCTFRADRRLYGVDISCLREISSPLPITPVPPAPPAIRGLANLRSRILLILDMRPLLGLAPADCTPDSRLLILKPSVCEDTGLLVDRGGDIVSVSPDRIEASAATAKPSAEMQAHGAYPVVTGVCKLENELMMIIDVTRLAATVGALHDVDSR